MNERIKQFEKQCWDHQTNHLDTEKFAELIVKECAKLIDAEESQSSYGDMLKQHFGVELDVNETLRNRSTYFGNDI